MSEDFDPEPGRDKVIRMTPKGLASVEGSTALLLHKLREHGALTIESLRNHCKRVFHWDDEWTDLIVSELKRLELVEVEDARPETLQRHHSNRQLY